MDQHGFYRKHTARDSTSLFRVISEQVYGIQNYHERVRAECINFMTNNRELFERQVLQLGGYDYENYLLDMSKPRTRGGQIELKAMAYLYGANIMLFEPYSTGMWYFKQRNFNRTIRVFCTAPSHYDTIYTKNYIEKVAFCQAIVYEILYEKVFEYPDVQYAVERMLYDPTGKTMTHVKGRFGEKAVTNDGREFVFDKAEDSNCILGDYKLCHFHNKDEFDLEIQKYKVRNVSLPTSYLMETNLLKSSLRLDHFLYDKDISCIRQLLEEGNN